MCIVPNPLLGYRIGNGNTSSDTDQAAHISHLLNARASSFLMHGVLFAALVDICNSVHTSMQQGDDAF